VRVGNISNVIWGKKCEKGMRKRGKVRRNRKKGERKGRKGKEKEERERKGRKGKENTENRKLKGKINA
jgi:hypothetical protein